MRIKIFQNVCIALFAVLALDLFYLQIIRGGYFARLSKNNSLRVVSFDGPRGRILDRNDRVLAESVKSYDVAIIPQDSDGKGRKAVYAFLARALNSEPAVFERKFNRGRISPFTPVPVATALTREQAILVEENACLYPGLIITRTYRRRYPQAVNGAHVIGYAAGVDAEKMRDLVNNGDPVPDLIGYTGVEEAYDERLRGLPGGREVEVNSRGREVRVLSLRDPAPGADIVLTVDQRIQAIATEVLAERRGAFVMLDPGTGEVLSLVSSPAFDPDAFSAGERGHNVSDYLNDNRSPLINRAFGAAFPPGSVFKIPLSFAGLQEHKITAETVFDCPGFYILGGRRYTFHHAYGQQNLIEALAHSANEYFFQTGFLLGPDKIADYARRFGLGEKTGISLPYEVAGHIPVRGLYRKWFSGDTANMSIGQGYVLATPLQLARLIAAVENEGRILTPYIVQSVGGERFGGTNRGERRVVFSRNVWDVIRRGLMAVVEMPTGTANALRIEGLRSYGKTGTAQTGAGKEDDAWFAGVTSGPKKKIAYCLFLEYGGSSYNAVIAVRDILIKLKELDIL